MFSSEGRTSVKRFGRFTVGKGKVTNVEKGYDAENKG